MAFKLSATNGTNKQYLFPTTDAASRGSRHWEYVSADAPGTVDGSNYITDSTAIAMLSVGDLIWVFQVGSIDDDRTIEADKAAGVTDISLHCVLENTGSVVDLSDDLLSATVTYGD